MEDPMRGREEEDEEGGEVVDLKTRRRFNQNPKSSSPTFSENSSIHSESSDISFEYFQGEQNKNNDGLNKINGGKAPITEGGSLDEETEGQKEENFEVPMNEQYEIIVGSNGVVSVNSNEGSSGISIHQNGLTVAYTHAGNHEVTGIAKSPDGGIGLKDFESMFDESFNNDTIVATDAYCASEEILNNASISLENGNVNLDLPNDPLPDMADINLEKEIQKQVFTPNNVENRTVILEVPKEDPLPPKVEQINVEAEIKKHVFTLNNAPQSVENGSVNLGHTNDQLPEVEEFDVERVIQKQDTHDFYCPNCNSCITKRVILKRRKRKIQEISKSEDVGSSTLSQSVPPLSDGIVEGTEEIESPEVDEEPIYAMTCLSCFSVFLPSRNGWLGRIFGRKPDVPAQPAGSLTEPLLSTSHGGTVGGEPVIDAELDDGEGHVFPLWIVNCCQPSSNGKRPLPPELTVPELEPEPEPKSEPTQEHPERQSEGNGDLRPTEHDRELPLAPPDGTRLSPIFTSVEGSKEEMKPYLPDESKLTSEIEALEKHVKYPLQAIAPATPKPHLPEVPLGKQISPDTEPDSDNTIASWFVNCCQPNKDGSRIKLPDVQDTPLPSKPEPTTGVAIELPRDSKAPTKPVAGTPVSLNPEPIPEPELPLSSEPISSIIPGGGYKLSHEFKFPATPTEGKGVLPNLEPILDPGTGTPLAPEPNLLSTPHDDVDARVPSKPTPAPTRGGGTPLAPHKPMPIPSPTPDDGGNPIITISDELVARRPPPLAPIPDDIPNQAGPLSSLDHPLLEQGLPRPRGGPGIDIIKAIVYGGLLESITSLSVIASAAGGDATTLNIVALGLANMFGGLVLLFHNLRILKNEHATEHYIQQLGRPGHFLLHATVAIVSYILFGLIGPIIYGFCFRKSDNKDFKLATLAAASFVCITVLSTAKAYVRNPPKAYIQTVFYYLAIALMVSGVGYAAGDLINELLKKLGVFDPKSVVPEGGGDITGLWASF